VRLLLSRAQHNPLALLSNRINWHSAAEPVCSCSLKRRSTNGDFGVEVKYRMVALNGTAAAPDMPSALRTRSLTVLGQNDLLDFA
jgi:hypothetical protein